MPKRSAKSADLAPSDAGTRAVVVSAERTPPASPDRSYQPSSPTYARDEDDDEVLVPNSQPWLTASPGYSPPPPNAPRSSASVPPLPLASAPVAPPAADSADRITSGVPAAVASSSLASPPAEVEHVLLFLVVEPGRVDNRVVAAYYSRARELELLMDWSMFYGYDGQVINHRTQDCREFFWAFSHLSCAHPRISDAHARQHLANAKAQPYRFALPPETNTCFKIDSIITIQWKE